MRNSKQAAGALCESFYPLLHVLEVTLRNSINDAIGAAYPSTVAVDVPSWLDATPSLLEPRFGQSSVAKAKLKLFGRKGRTASSPRIPPGKLIAELDFGFWTGLFHTYYMYQSAKDQRFWPQLLPVVFPHKSPRPKHPAEVSVRFNEIRLFRNRVFHHEPIWKRPNLLQDRQYILDAIGWISPETTHTVSRLDRVAEVFDQSTLRKIRIAIHRSTSGKPKSP